MSIEISQRADTRVVVTRKRGFPHTGWMWEEIVGDLEQALQGDGARPLGSDGPNEALDIAGRLLSRVGVPRLAVGSEWRVVALMGTKPRLLFPHAYRGRVALFVWDCWPDAERRWSSIFASIRPEVVFFTSNRAAEFWAPRLPGVHVEWLPEGINPLAYSAGDLLESRAVDLLEIGRPFEQFTAQVAPALADLGYIHRHPTETHPHLFADREQLIRGISSAKLLACFPASVTDPHGRSGGWETMTYRYLEAVASRTLIVGKVPAEMIELFGFSPGVDLDPVDYPSHVVHLLKTIGEHQELVDRSRARLLEIGSWSVRARHILEVIASRDGRVASG